jgi:hypothetical protein
MKKVRPLEVNGRTECVLGIGLLASAILCRWLRWLGASGQVTLLWSAGFAGVRLGIRDLK